MKKHTRRFFVQFSLTAITIFFLTRFATAKEKIKQLLPYHHLSEGGFRNLEGAPKRLTPEERKKYGGDIRKFFLKRVFSTEEIPILKKYQISPQEILRGWNKALNSNISFTFLGHASFLIRIGKINVLTDPFLTQRAGVGFFGPKRFNPAGFSPQDLPPIDVIFLSHNHYDHFDAPSLKKVKNKKNIPIIVPLKLKKSIEKLGYKNIIEMDWFEKTKIKNLDLTFLPAVHWSRRLGQDTNETLWGGLLIESQGKTIYFSGDTAYSEQIFKNLAKKIPRPDVAILPIGAYSPRWFMRASHTTPEEAVKIGEHLKAKNLIAMHWGSIVLSTEDIWEPPIRMEKAAMQANYKKENIWIMANGETKIYT